MKKRVVKLLLIVLIFVIGISISFSMQKKDNYSEKIEEVLASKLYAGLPEEAKEYIREEYEKTGEIVLLEDNKKENEYYLNPEYIHYLSLEDKSNYEFIPSEQIIDFVSDEKNEEYGATYPSSYDLRNVNGKNFTTPNKNQYSSGDCWIFSTNAIAEHYLLLKANQTYTSSAKIFSEAQIDYATSTNGISNGKSLYQLRNLYSGGGNFSYAIQPMLDGLGLADRSWNNYLNQSSNYSGTKLDRTLVYSYNNSQYEVDATTTVPYINFSGSYTDSQVNEYLNTVKKLVTTSGGAFVGTQGPGYGCSAKNMYDNSTTILRVDGHCSKDAGHALTVIGWDDNYSYKYCYSSTQHFTNENGTCANQVTGKGAWILKNSWGTSSSYVYLAYDSLDSEFYGITKISQKNWNVTHTTKALYTSYGMKFTKKVSGTREKLAKVKIYNRYANMEYTVEFSKNGTNYTEIARYTPDAVGYKDIDLSGSSYIADTDTFYIRVKNGGSLSLGDVRIYTTYLDSSPKAQTAEAQFPNTYSDPAQGYYMKIETDTVGVPEGSILSYRIKDKNGNLISSYYQFGNAVVAANHVTTDVRIADDLIPGNYTLEALYNGQVIGTSLLKVISQAIHLSGTGTRTDPYLISSAVELNYIRSNLSAYYKLTADIDLTEMTQDPEGIYYNEGMGWEPIGTGITSTTAFSGGFDGDGHKITGLKMYRPNTAYAGLFGSVVSNGYSYIQNLTLEDVNIYGGNFTGALVGYYVTTQYQSYSGISNIIVRNGSVESLSSYIGGIIGEANLINYSNEYYNLYNGASVKGKNYVGGIVGYLKAENYKQTLQDIENTGSVNATIYAGAVGYIYANSVPEVHLENAINTGSIYASSGDGFVGYVTASSSGIVTLKNVYYTNATLSANPSYITQNNVLKLSIKDIKTASRYTTWASFSSNWKLETINGYTRIPLLKNVDFEYTGIDGNNFIFEKDETIDILSLLTITPEDKKEMIDIKSNNTSIISIDATKKLKTLAYGSTTITLTSNYDGMEKNIDITVINPKIFTITYISNGGSGTMNNDEYEIVTEEDSDEESEEEPFKLILQQNKYTRVGYRFVSWNTKQDGSGISFANKQEFDELPMEHAEYNVLKLYAIWTPITYYVKFNANGGSGTMPNQIHTYDAQQSLSLNSFHKKGYEFEAWNENASGTGKAYVNAQYVLNLMTTQNTIKNLYAIWKPINYTVKFNSNGGIGTMASQVFTYDKSSLLSPNTYKRNGYEFIGWNTSPDGSGTMYQNSSSILNITDVKETITLYAIWEELPQIIIDTTYDYNDQYFQNITQKTTISSYINNIQLNSNYTYKIFDANNSEITNNDELITTGSKLKIYRNNELCAEYTNVIAGDASGDGKVNYLDYVAVYNHIQKVKHPESTKKLLENAKYIAADMTKDGTINYLDYIKIYKAIKGE